MRWIKKVFCCLFASCFCLILGCSRRNHSDMISVANAAKIEPWMERQEVIDILGPPRYSMYAKDNIHQEGLFYAMQNRRHPSGEPDYKLRFFVVVLVSNKVWHSSMVE